MGRGPITPKPRLPSLAPVVFLALAVQCLSSCGGEPRTEESEQAADRPFSDTADPSQVGENAAVPPDICALLDVEELEIAFEEPLLEGRGDSGEDWASCEWMDAVHEHFRMSLAVYFRGGREAWRIEHAARAGAERLIEAQENIEVDSIVRPGPVAGLGDAAHYNGLLPSQVLIGDTLIHFTMPLMITSAVYFRPLAKKVIRRLRGEDQGVRGEDQDEG